MKKWIKGFLLGFLISAILFTNFIIYASGGLEQTINVVLNSINLDIDGSRIADIGQDYLISNGDEVPYSILYKGTTYLPIRKVSEIFNKEIEWNGSTNTVILGKSVSEERSFTLVDDIEIYDDIKVGYAASGLRIDDKVYQFFPGYIIDTSNGLYLWVAYDASSSDPMYEFEQVKYLMALVNNDYEIIETDNPYYDGSIRIIDHNNAAADVIYNEYFDYEKIYTDVNSFYYQMKIYDFEKLDYYEFTFGKDYKGLLDVGSYDLEGDSKYLRGIYLPYKELVRLYSDMEFTYKYDDDKDMLIFEFNALSR